MFVEPIVVDYIRRLIAGSLELSCIVGPCSAQLTVIGRYCQRGQLLETGVLWTPEQGAWDFV
jgi:hypothetical protein